MDANFIDPDSLSILSSPPWWRDILLVLVGGICGIAGSVLTTLGSIWYQTKKARKMKMEETIGEQKVDACKKALGLAEQLRATLLQDTSDDVLGFIKSENTWVLDNEGLLPFEFVVNWRSVRLAIVRVRRTDRLRGKLAEEPAQDTLANIITEQEKFALELAQEAEDVIRKDLRLPPFKLRHRNEDLGTGKLRRRKNADVDVDKS